MGWSGDLSTSNQYIKYRINITENSQSIANNTSNVTVKVWVYRTNTGYTTYGTGTVYVKINGTSYSASITNDQKITNSGVYIFNKTLNISHSSDGSKTLSTSAYINHDQFTSSEQSYSQTLTTIPRASTLSLSAATTEMGSSVTITISRASTSFKHTLKYKFGSASGTIGTDIATTKTWEIPLTLANQIPSATSGSGTITCETYNGSTLIGSKAVSFKTTVPASVVPSISSVSVSDPTGNATTYGGYVQKKSKLKVQASASGSYKSTISKYEITINGTKYTSSTCTTNAITESAGTKSGSVKVTDSRGRTATKSFSYTVLAYSSPSISKLTASRCNQNGTANDEGAYIKITYAGTITSLNSKNAKNFVLKHKAQDTSTWTTAVNTNQYSVNSSVIISANINSSYDISFTAKDSFSTAEKTWQVSTAFTLMDFGASGKGLAVGKVSEQDAFEVNMNTYLSNGTDKTQLIFESAKEPSLWFKRTDSAALGVIYLSSHTEGRMTFACGKTDGSDKTYVFSVHPNGIFPVTTNATYCGTETNKWSKVVATDGIFTGNLTIGGHSTPVGSQLTASGTGTAVSVNTATWTSICSLTLPAGTWIITATASFGSNGNYNNGISINSSRTNYSSNTIVFGKYQSWMQSVYSVTLTSENTYYLVAYQASGSAMNIIPRSLRAVRIA